MTGWWQAVSAEYRSARRDIEAGIGMLLGLALAAVLLTGLLALGQWLAQVAHASRLIVE